MLSRACMTPYDRPHRWDGSPSSQYEWSTQHSPKIPVEVFFTSYGSENLGVESTVLLCALILEQHLNNKGSFEQEQRLNNTS